MKYRKNLSLLLVSVFLCTALSNISGELIPTANALYPLNDGTVLDPGSHGLIIEDIDTRRITNRAEIIRWIKAQNELFEEKDFELYYDGYSFWEVTVKVKNNFPVDLYGFNLMFTSLNAYYSYYGQWWHNFGHTSLLSDKAYLPDGYDVGEVVMKPGETLTHTFCFYAFPDGGFFSDDQNYVKYLHVEWYECWTKDDCFTQMVPQISPYSELDDYEKVAEENGISIRDMNTAATEESDEIEITSMELLCVKTDDIPEEYLENFSEEDILLELRATFRNHSDKDVKNPDLDLLFYNKDGDMVRRSSDYSGKGVVPAGKEADLFVGYYYVEDPYYIPQSIRETFGTQVFETPVILYHSADLTADAETVAAGAYHTVYVRADGTVGAVGYTNKDRCKVAGWEDIIAVAASSHTVGLKSDGTVVATGPNGRKQCDVSGWEDIVAIAVGDEHTVGLKADGSVVAVGNSGQKRLNVSDWEDIVAVAAGGKTTYGLKSDGTVVATGSNANGQANVEKWENIEAIAAGDTHVLGLRSDGNVLCAGSYESGEGRVSRAVYPAWRDDIIAVAAGSQVTYGLKADGTVIATGNNKYGQCDVSDWTDIVAISAGMHYVIGIRADGSYITAGSNSYGQCDLK